MRSYFSVISVLCIKRKGTFLYESLNCRVGADISGLKMNTSTRSVWQLCIFLFLFGGRGLTEYCETHMSETEFDTAIDMLKKAKHFCTGTEWWRAADCADWFKMGFRQNGVYAISLHHRIRDGKPLDVFCDMNTDGGGWTLIQRRQDAESLRRSDYFYKDWESYKQGFGDVEKSFWLGNDNIFAISNQKRYSVRFDLKSFDDDDFRYALYDSFWIDDEAANYRLYIEEYSGDAGDSMTEVHNGQMFSTYDRNNAASNDSCAVKYRGAWWYNNCYRANLNGLYLKSEKSAKNLSGIQWYNRGNEDEPTWNLELKSLYRTEIKLRPYNFNRKENMLCDTR